VSYRELPLRLAEFGSLPPQRAFGCAARHHAVRAFTQDDAHIFLYR